MRELMMICARANVVCREKRHGKVWLAAPGAKRGFLVTVQDAPSLVAHGPRMYTVAMAQGLTPQKG